MTTKLMLTGLLFSSALVWAVPFSCPTGQADMMKYFILDQSLRHDHFLDGKPNPIYPEVFPDADFADSGYWFWLKSPKAHGFDVKSYDEKYIYMRATELTWVDNTSFKRFEHDLPIAARCVPESSPGPEIRVSDTTFNYFSSCRTYKSSTVGTAVNNLDAPERTDVGGNLGTVWTRVLHYRYNCDKHFKNCRDEEQFLLANGYGLYQWKHYRNGELVKTALMNELREGRASAGLPCSEAYR
jgi:hypothetical protein